MSYIVAEYVTEWRFTGLHVRKKWRIYFKPFSCGRTMRRSNGWPHKHLDTLTQTNAKGENAMRSISLGEIRIDFRHP